jgi:protein TonB
VKRNSDLTIAFVLAVLLHGLALLMVGFLPDRAEPNPLLSDTMGMDGRPVEMRIPDMAMGEHEAVSVEKEVSVEERPVAFSDASMPDIPEHRSMESRVPPSDARPKAMAKGAARWVDLLPEPTSAGTAGVGVRAVSEGAVLPELSGFTRPRYPLAARQRGEEGRVTLRVRVDASGVARETRLTKSSGYGELDRTAVAAVGKATFRPAREGGKAVEAECELVFEFRLEDQ